MILLLHVAEEHGGVVRGGEQQRSTGSTPAWQLRQGPRRNIKQAKLLSNHSPELHREQYFHSELLHVLIKGVTLPHPDPVKMAPPTDRKEILAGFRKQIDSGTAIVGAGAGM